MEVGSDPHSRAYRTLSHIGGAIALCGDAMKCGDLPQKFLTKTGTPCGQIIPDSNTVGCLWHSGDLAKQAEFKMKGKIGAQTAKSIPELMIGDLTSDDGISTTLQSLCEVAAMKAVDLRRVSEIRQALGVAVSLQNTKATRELNKTLMRLEHGQKAVVLLEQLKGDATRRPTPIPLKKVPHGA